MKGITTLLLSLVLSLTSTITFAQCDSDEFLDECAELLDDYTYVKVFDVNTDKKVTKMEYSSVFSKNHEYRLAIKGGTELSQKKIIVNLYDRNKKLISSSYYKPQNLHVSKLGYKCSATGVYYIEAYFEDNATNCGIIILGFKKTAE